MDFYLVFPTNFRIEFLPHTNTVILQDLYCETQSLGYLDSLSWTDSPSPVFSPSQFLVDQGTPLVVVVIGKAGAFVGEEVQAGGCKQSDELMFRTCLLIHSFSVFSATS